MFTSNYIFITFQLIHYCLSTLRAHLPYHRRYFPDQFESALMASSVSKLLCVYNIPTLMSDDGPPVFGVENRVPLMSRGAIDNKFN